MCVIAKGFPRGCQGLFTPVSLGYPLSVFNKNSTLKYMLETYRQNLLHTKNFLKICRCQTGSVIRGTNQTCTLVQI